MGMLSLHSSSRTVDSMSAWKRSAKRWILALSLAGFVRFPSLSIPTSPLQEGSPAAWEISLRELGVSEPLVLSAPSGEQWVTIPVPQGLRPVELTGRLRSTPGLNGGRLEIGDGVRTLTWVPLGLAERTLTVALQGASVTRGRLTLVWRLIPPPRLDICAAGSSERVELEDLRVRLEGSPEPPRTIAGFWPSDLRALEVNLPADPGPEEATAALRLVALGARLAGRHPLTVSIRLGEGSFAGAADPWRRRIEIRRGEARLRLRFDAEGLFPALEIQAPPERVVELADGVIRYGEVMAFPEVIPQRIAPAEEGISGPVTLAELGWPQIQMRGSGPMEARLFLSQADLGGPVRGVRLRLVGRATPVPEGGTASLLVFLNGGLVAAEPLPGGAFDRRIAFPDGLWRRDNTVIVRVDYTPPGGECRVGVHPITVFIDGRSSLEFQRGQNLPPGFERFPQSLMPAFGVGLRPLNASTLQAAADLVVLLQQATHRPLRPEVRPWEEAVRTSGGLVLITEEAEGLAGLDLPLDPRPFRLVDVDGREGFRVDPGRAFLVLEAFEDRGRGVLVLTRWGREVDLGRWVEGMDRELGWFGLQGDVWLWPVGGEPVAWRVRGSGWRVEPLPPVGGGVWERLWPWALGVVLVGVLGFLIWAYPRVVRRRPAGLEGSGRPADSHSHKPESG
jgi:hypothetical protein